MTHATSSLIISVVVFLPFPLISYLLLHHISLCLIHITLIIIFSSLFSHGRILGFKRLVGWVIDFTGYFFFSPSMELGVWNLLFCLGYLLTFLFPSPRCVSVRVCPSFPLRSSHSEWKPSHQKRLVYYLFSTVASVDVRVVFDLMFWFDLFLPDGCFELLLTYFGVWSFFCIIFFSSFACVSYDEIAHFGHFCSGTKRRENEDFAFLCVLGALGLSC